MKCAAECNKNHCSVEMEGIVLEECTTEALKIERDFVADYFSVKILRAVPLCISLSLSLCLSLTTHVGKCACIYIHLFHLEFFVRLIFYYYARGEV
jgi:DMSO reductase anchor subunit